MNITKALATLALGAALLAPTPASAQVSGTVSACEQEDSVGCVWDARHMGNGEGKSFRAFKDGRIKYISHRRAHTLAYGSSREVEVVETPTSPEGTWEECFWNGIRWNAPCAYDHNHSVMAGTSSYVMYPRNGQVVVDTVPHRLAHYLLGY